MFIPLTEEERRFIQFKIDNLKKEIHDREIGIKSLEEKLTEGNYCSDPQLYINFKKKII